MTRQLTLKPHNVTREDRGDGSIILRSAYDIGPVAPNTGAWLDHWAAASPDAVFMAERQGAGWREMTYAQTLNAVQSIASHLLDRDLGAERPIMVLSGNGVDHGLLTLAAQYVGIPTVPLAEQYALIPQAHERLSYAAGVTTPGLIYAVDADRYGPALALKDFDGVAVIASENPGNGMIDFADWLTPSGTDIAAAKASVTHDTLAKILFTSGSTSNPKGVLTTHGMMCTNQAQLAACLPFLTQRPPVIVDWLPWNHVFGGSHNFNMMLANGGSLYIDDGKPAPGMFARTAENLALQSATLSFNVPIGFAQLVTALKEDKALRETYFADLDMIFYAGASLPAEVWTALEEMALQTGGKKPLITTSWGLTETAPAAMISHEQVGGAGVIGVPVPGVEVKLMPLDDARYDIRLRGPSITKGYLRNPEKTAEAFDKEGFFITGDAMKICDPSDVNRGLTFDGRLSEDFKLTTGTWVQSANLRLAILGVLDPLAQDVVITGQGRDAVSVLVLPNRGAMAAQGWHSTQANGVLTCPQLNTEIIKRLKDHAAKATGSATRITAALVLSDPPSVAQGEATAKGNINFPKFLSLRSALVDRLYDPKDTEVLRICP
jgi:feruloyl-CoA synthase